MCTCDNPFTWWYLRLSSLFCAGRRDVLPARGERRDCPPAAAVCMKAERSLPFAFYFGRAEPAPLVRGQYTAGNWNTGRLVVRRDECWAVPAASLPVAPPLLVLSCIIFQQSGLSYKKVENKENYFFLIIELYFPDGLVLLESCFNTVFSISIDSSNKIKLY